MAANLWVSWEEKQACSVSSEAASSSRAGAPSTLTGDADALLFPNKGGRTRCHPVCGHSGIMVQGSASWDPLLSTLVGQPVAFCDSHFQGGLCQKMWKTWQSGRQDHQATSFRRPGAALRQGTAQTDLHWRNDAGVLGSSGPLGARHRPGGGRHSVMDGN